MSATYCESCAHSVTVQRDICAACFERAVTAPPSPSPASLPREVVLDRAEVVREFRGALDRLVLIEADRQKLKETHNFTREAIEAARGQIIARRSAIHALAMSIGITDDLNAEALQ